MENVNIRIATFGDSVRSTSTAKYVNITAEHQRRSQ
jgi:hypothetical protein